MSLKTKMILMSKKAAEDSKTPQEHQPGQRTS
jgi:hypothetical protein